MKTKIYGMLKKIYAIIMMVSFWAGGLPIIPFIIALIIGGSIGENISIFLIKNYYPWVIVLASVAVLIGLVALYINKNFGFSVKDLTKSNEESK
jgi:hypothetical protein